MARYPPDLGPPCWRPTKHYRVKSTATIAMMTLGSVRSYALVCRIGKAVCRSADGRAAAVAKVAGRYRMMRRGKSRADTGWCGADGRQGRMSSTAIGGSCWPAIDDRDLLAGLVVLARPVTARLDRPGVDLDLAGDQVDDPVDGDPGPGIGRPLLAAVLAQRRCRRPRPAAPRRRAWGSGAGNRHRCPGRRRCRAPARQTRGSAPAVPCRADHPAGSRSASALMSCDRGEAVLRRSLPSCPPCSRR